MVQPAIDIPRPHSADTETVATALETAELFRSRGDTHEAIRWLRRAAESAGEAGDDERALALSRQAADWHEALEAQPASAARLSAAPVSVPRPSAPSASPPPTSALNGTPPPLPTPPLPSSQPPPVTAFTPPVTPSTPPVTARPTYPAPPSSRPGFQAAPSRPPVAPSTPATSSGRNATRVAITRSPTQPGVFEMRLLTDGESAPPGGSEGYLVMIDPTSTLLSS